VDDNNENKAQETTWQVWFKLAVLGSSLGPHTNYTASGISYFSSVPT
jgi:hypothetical protein